MNNQSSFEPSDECMNRVYNLILQPGIPLTIVKGEMMMPAKGPKLRRSLEALRISSLCVLVVVAARVLSSPIFLHESVLYRRGGATCASYDHPCERV